MIVAPPRPAGVYATPSAPCSRRLTTGPATWTPTRRRADATRHRALARACRASSVLPAAHGVTPTNLTPGPAWRLDLEIPASPSRSGVQPAGSRFALSRGLAGSPAQWSVTFAAPGCARDGWPCSGRSCGTPSADPLRRPPSRRGGDRRCWSGPGGGVIGSRVSAESNPVDWETARRLAYDAGRAVAGPAQAVPLDEADGRTLAEPLLALTDLPAFPTSSIDGWAVRGPAPWRPVGRVLAGHTAPVLDTDGMLRDRHGAMSGRPTRHPARRGVVRDDAGLVAASSGPREWRLRAGGHRVRADNGRHRHRPAIIGVAATCATSPIGRPRTRARCASSATSGSQRPAGDGRVPLARPADAGWMRRAARPRTGRGRRNGRDTWRARRRDPLRVESADWSAPPAARCTDRRLRHPALAALAPSKCQTTRRASRPPMMLAGSPVRGAPVPAGLRATAVRGHRARPPWCSRCWRAHRPGTHRAAPGGDHRLRLRPRRPDPPGASPRWTRGRRRPVGQSVGDAARAAHAHGFTSSARTHGRAGDLVPSCPAHARVENAEDVTLVEVFDRKLDLAAHEAAVADQRDGAVVPAREWSRPEPETGVTCWSTKDPTAEPCWQRSPRDSGGPACTPWQSRTASRLHMAKWHGRGRQHGAPGGRVRRMRRRVDGQGTNADLEA